MTASKNFNGPNTHCVLTGKESVIIENRPIPKCGADQVLVKVMATGMCVSFCCPRAHIRCGSDLSYYKNGGIGTSVVKKPLVLGHESSGEIYQVGENVSGLKVGDRVAIEPALPCRVCRYCKGGKFNCCMNDTYMASPPTGTFKAPAGRALTRQMERYVNGTLALRSTQSKYPTRSRGKRLDVSNLWRLRFTLPEDVVFELIKTSLSLAAVHWVYCAWRLQRPTERERSLLSTYLNLALLLPNHTSQRTHTSQLPDQLVRIRWSGIEKSPLLSSSSWVQMLAQILSSKLPVKKPRSSLESQCFAMEGHVSRN